MTKPKDEAADLKTLLDSINKDYGAGTIMRLGDGELAAVEVFSTGSIALDEALGVGGLPRGRIIEIYGPESSGKTSLALHAVGNAQRQGLRAAFIDAEQAFDPAWAETLGVDVENLYVTQPSSGEQALVIAHRLALGGHFGVIVIDSVAALVPGAELKGEIGDTHVALQARMMSQALRMLTTPAADTGTAIIFINQLREKVGVFFGSSETQPGGKALKFYASIRLDVRRIETIKDGAVPVGSLVRVKVVKNKVAKPFMTAEFDFLFDVGISRSAELLRLGVERGVLKKSGAWYSDPQLSVNLGNGRAEAISYLDAHPDHAAAVEEAVRKLPAAPKASRKREEALEMDGPAPWDEASS